MNHVCGIIVTFNPAPGTVENIGRISSQLEWLVVVDNGSQANTLEPIREASARLGFTLLELHRNLGIAAALNRGVERARNLQAQWVALFDQDSSSEPNLIESLLDTYTKEAPSSKVAIVSAKHLRCDTQAWMRPVFAIDGGPLVAITSGSLMPLSVFTECGLFEEDFIIDRVDEEHCLRVRTLGYTIVHCDQGILWVTLGNPRPFQLFGKTLFRATHYSPGRRYYNTRNRLIIAKRYWRLYPRWCYWTVSGLAKELAIVLIAEKQRGLKIRNTILGIRDALLNRMGMMIPL